MNRHYPATVALMVALIAPTVAGSQTPAPPAGQQTVTPESLETKFTVAGRKSLVREFYALETNCVPLEWMELFVVQAPEHGRAETGTRDASAFYVEPNPRTACNGKSVPAQVLYYTPDAGYTGPDSLIVESVSSNAFASRVRMNILVRQPPSNR